MSPRGGSADRAWYASPIVDRPHPDAEPLYGAEAPLDAWIEAARERVAPGLSFPEIRKAVQAVSSLYVERRASVGLGAKTTESAGKRAAFATYYAPLHLLIARRAASMLPDAVRKSIRRVHDLGCGTGASGVGFVQGCGGALEVHGLDRSGWALSEARHTFAQFGVAGRTRRAAIPEALPKLRPGDAVVAGWSANELEADARARLLDFLMEAVRGGNPIVLIEPLAKRIAPWWPTFARALVAYGVRDVEIRFEPPLPRWIERLDEASGLDHRELRARALLWPIEGEPAGGVDEDASSGLRQALDGAHGEGGPGPDG